MTSTASYSFNIDFSNNGSWVDANEDVSTNVLSEFPCKIVRGRDQARLLSPPMAGKAGFELDNTSRLYSRENSTGALYGNLLPGRPVRIQSSWNSTTYDLFQGYLSELTPHTQPGRRTVTVSALGSLSRLTGESQAQGITRQKVSTALYQNITTDVAIGYVLDAIGWSTAKRVLDTGKTTLQWWWLDEEDPMEALRALIATEGPGASLYEDGQGRIVFESRHYRFTTTRCTASQATFSSTGEPYAHEPFEYNDGIRDVINLCTVEQKIRSIAGSSSVVWSLGTDFDLAAGEARDFIAVSNTGDPFTNASVPANGTDFTVTGSTSVTTSMGSPGSGVRKSFRITNQSLTQSATISGLQMRAQLVAVDNTVAVTAQSTASQDKYGLRTYNPPVRAEIALNSMQDLVNAVVALYKEPRPTLSFNLVGQSTSALSNIFTREVSDRVTVIETQVGTTGDWFVERLEHGIEFGGQWHELKIGCEKVPSEQYARWGSSGTVYTRWASTGFTSTDTDKGVWAF